MSAGRRTNVLVNARGRWKSILIKLGVEEKVLDGRHHACPVTGEGDDRFRFSNKDGKGSFFCGCNNGSGDGMQLLKCKFGMDFKAAAVAVEEIIGATEVDDDTKKKSAVTALADLKAIQSAVRSQCRSLRLLEEMTSYLRGRGIDQIPAALQVANLNYAIGPQRTYAAMVAKFVNRDGKPVTYHITYLENGKKADIKRQRVIATPAIPMAGGAVRLYPLDGKRLGVAEGIETAISASILYGMPVWACLNTAMLEAFDPPDEVEELIIFSDRDRNFAGQKAAFALGHRLAMKRSNIDVDVTIPLLDGEDFNDELVRWKNGN